MNKILMILGLLLVLGGAFYAHTGLFIMIIGGCAMQTARIRGS